MHDAALTGQPTASATEPGKDPSITAECFIRRLPWWALMATKHGDYTLFAREVELKGGHKQTIYFFSKRVPKVGEKADAPDEYDVVEHRGTGIPYLRRRH